MLVARFFENLVCGRLQLAVFLPPCHIRVDDFTLALLCHSGKLIMQELVLPLRLAHELGENLLVHFLLQVFLLLIVSKPLFCICSVSLHFGTKETVLSL